MDKGQNIGLAGEQTANQAATIGVMGVYRNYHTRILLDVCNG